MSFMGKGYMIVPRNPSKLYTIDPAFKRAVSITEDKGRVFENMVYLELLRCGENAYYYSGKQETDFVTEGRELINASFSLDDEETRKREVNGLFESMEVFGINQSFLLNYDEKGTIKKGNYTVEILPFWRWVLES